MDVAAVELVLGRPLSGVEREQFESGAALVLDSRLVSNGEVHLVTPQQLLGGTAEKPLTLAALVVRPGEGTAVSLATPAVFIQDDPAEATTGIGSGQVQAAFLFDAPITADQEEALRIAILKRAEVVSDSEFMFTWLDAAQKGLAGLILNRLWIPLVGLIAMWTMLLSSSLWRSLRTDGRSLHAAGVSVAQQSALVGLCSIASMTWVMVTGTIVGVAAGYAAFVLELKQAIWPHLPSGVWVAVLTQILVAFVALGVTRRAT